MQIARSSNSGWCAVMNFQPRSIPPRIEDLQEPHDFKSSGQRLWCFFSVVVNLYWGGRIEPTGCLIISPLTDHERVFFSRSATSNYLESSTRGENHGGLPVVLNNQTQGSINECGLLVIQVVRLRAQRTRGMHRLTMIAPHR